MGLDSHFSTHSLCVCSSVEGRICRKCIQAYLSNKLAPKGRSVAILNDNGTEFENKVLNDVGDHAGI